MYVYIDNKIITSRKETKGEQMEVGRLEPETLRNLSSNTKVENKVWGFNVFGEDKGRRRKKYC